MGLAGCYYQYDKGDGRILCLTGLDQLHLYFGAGFGDIWTFPATWIWFFANATMSFSLRSHGYMLICEWPVKATNTPASG